MTDIINGHTAQDCPDRIHASTQAADLYLHGACKPMPFNLDEARRLHDRNPGCPAFCLTCSDEEGNRVDWPCATATALGATGRSEWTNGPETITTPRQTEPAQPCTDTDNTGGTCVLDHGHRCEHIHGDLTWPRCTQTNGTNTCRMADGHDGWHRLPNGGSWGPPGAIIDQHTVRHINENGGMW